MILKYLALTLVAFLIYRGMVMPKKKVNPPQEKEEGYAEYEEIE